MTTDFKIENKAIKYNFDALASQQLIIASIPYNYEVSFVNEGGIKLELEKILALNKSKHFLYIDEKVATLYGPTLFAKHETMLLNAKEDNKVLSVATLLLDKLQEKNFTKNELFVSAGGGITQDISAFARAVYKRGINWIYIPTTLLAMSDSCIGSKSCLNYGSVKNQLGLFSAPRKVYICSELLKSLNIRDVLSGYGEIIKLAIVGGKESINKFIELTAEQGNDKLKNIDQLIKLSLLIKKSVIEIDEFEDDIRRALNYGHTIGHAIEPLVNYNIPHGVAVSIGIIIENLLAARYGSLSQTDADYLNSIIINFIDKESIGYLKNVSVEVMIRNMKRDKKAVTDDIYLAVPFQIGHFDILKLKSDSDFKNFLTKAIQGLININAII